MRHTLSFSPFSVDAPLEAFLHFRAESTPGEQEPQKQEYVVPGLWQLRQQSLVFCLAQQILIVVLSQPLLDIRVRHHSGSPFIATCVIGLNIAFIEKEMKKPHVAFSGAGLFQRALAQYLCWLLPTFAEWVL